MIKEIKKIEEKIFYECDQCKETYENNIEECLKCLNKVQCNQIKKKLKLILADYNVRIDFNKKYDSIWICDKLAAYPFLMINLCYFKNKKLILDIIERRRINILELEKEKEVLEIIFKEIVEKEND